MGALSTRFHRTGNNLFTVLAEGVEGDDLTMRVAASGLDFLQVPFLADVGGEIVSVSDVAVDTPDPGVTQWTVQRAVYGSAGSYLAGVPVAQRNYAENLNELQDGASAIWSTVKEILTGDVGTVGVDTGEVIPLNAFSPNVYVRPGPVLVGGIPFEIPPMKVISIPVPPSGTVTYSICVDSNGQIVRRTEGPESGEAWLADVIMNHTDTEVGDEAVEDRRTGLLPDGGGTVDPEDLLDLVEDVVEGVMSPLLELVGQMTTGLMSAWGVIRSTLAEGDGVVTGPDGSSLFVAVDNGMTATVQGGSCVIDGLPVSIPSTDLVLTCPPSGGSWYLVLIDGNGDLSQHLQDSRGDPAPAGFLALAETFLMSDTVLVEQYNVDDVRRLI